MSHQAYGPKVGVPRILRMLERTGVTRRRSSCPASPPTCYPAMVESIVAAGHELGHHGYSHVPYHRMTDDEQRATSSGRSRASSASPGLRPEGFRAPWWELTNSTPGILADFGVRGTRA